MITAILNVRQVLLTVSILFWTASSLTAQQGEPKQSADKTGKATAPKIDPAQLKRLAKDHEIWVDLKRRFVVIGGEVCLREGALEMFACSQGSKEHESVVAVKSPARFAHAALLAVGAKVGNVVRFSPEYKPASGTTIDIWVLWKDKDGMQRTVRAQDWIKNVRTDKPMKYDWVFAGSGFMVDEETGQRYYYADGGDFICVSNFSTATLDLPVKSSQDTADLLFAAFTKNIPPLETPVRLVLVPRLGKKPAAKSPAAPK